jgi:Flp pilus assembly secretin CpaC
MQAPRAAAIALVGAGAAGWPTSMWITRPPAASMRAAAAITSITMKAGTSLRAEGLINRRAASNIASMPLMPRADPAPLSPHFCAQFAPQRSRNQT